nr:sensor histidine kinase [Spirosomataceae bacterium]
DTMRAKRQINESVAIQNQFELDQLALQSRQAQELQAQKMLAFQKQTEIDRLRAKATTDQLRAEAQQTALQNQLQTEALKTQAQKTQQAQQAQINSLKISELDKQLTLENRTRNFLVGGITFLFLVGIVLLKLNSKLKSQNAQLAAKNREITEALLKGQTTERKRVAAELHDNLGGLLGALKMTTNVLDASTLHPQEQEIYGQIVKMIDEANVQIRSLSHNMLPEQLEKQGLVASLETLVSKLNLGQKTKFNLVASGLLQRLPKQTEFNLYTIVLELCNNILKHANATEALIELHQKNDALHLLVTDNGSGFDTQSSTEGMGFQNLKERANATGGDLKIRSLKGEGTVISLKISQPTRAESQI